MAQEWGCGPQRGEVKIRIKIKTSTGALFLMVILIVISRLQFMRSLGLPIGVWHGRSGSDVRPRPGGERHER